MSGQDVYTLIDPQTGQLALKLYRFEDGRHFDHIQRNNYYSLIWLESATGTARANVAAYPLAPNSLFAFSPYQPFMFAATALAGTALHFHPDFFCIHKHQKEVACNGVLFNNIYQPPFIAVSESAAAALLPLILQMQQELASPSLAQQEALVAWLKLFLITASRLWAQQQPATEEIAVNKKPPILQQLKDAIERDFRTKHSAGDYAAAVNISLKTLAKITKAHFSKTLTELIAERIIIEAKRELYLTNKPVKMIAYELGYDDEYYFSRFFRQRTDASPQQYRETVGAARAV